MSQEDTPTRRAVDARMAELGIEKYGELAERAGVDPSTISNLLNEQHAPRGPTVRGIAQALLWPKEWVDYVRSGVDVPAAKVAAEDRGEYRWRGHMHAFDPTTPVFDAMVTYGTRFAAIASELGLQPMVGFRSNPDRPIAEVRSGDMALLASIEIVVVHGSSVDPERFQAWVTRLKAARLTASVEGMGAEVKTVGWFVGDDVEQAMGPYSQDLDQLRDVYDIHVPVGDGQMRETLERIASPR